MPQLKTIIWFLKRPKYYPQIFQIIKRDKEKEKTREEATTWCQKNCMSQQEALKTLTGQDNLPQLQDLFPEVITQAQELEEKAPVKMGGSGATTFIYHLVKKSTAQKLIETGVAYGWSSLAILLAVENNKEAKLISNDMPYVSMNNEDYVGCIIPEYLKNHWELQRLPDVKGIPLALKKFNNEINFCHYDSDKSYTGRMWASPLLWNALSKNGFFIADDINDNLAFKHFCESVNRTPVIIEHNKKYVGVIVK
jgi:hypothetical protein